jgi:hypothetical protein
MQHLRSFDRIYLKQLRRLCLDNGMSIPSFPVSTEFGLYPDRINAEIEKCRVAMETGLFLGAPLVRVFVGSTPPGGNPQDAFARGVDALRRCAEIGADIGMVVALQNHSGLTSTGDDMLRFHQAVNHPNFSLVLDTGHFTGRQGPNGPKQEGHTGDMIHDVASLIEYLSSFMTLSPGDVILTGTPKGSVDVQPGDEVVCEVQGVGRLLNTLVADWPAGNQAG